MVLFMAASGIGALMSFSLPGYILERTSIGPAERG